MEIDAAAYPLPPSAVMSPRSGAQSPAPSFSFDYPLHSSGSSNAASPASSSRSLGPDPSSSTVPGRSRSALSASLAMTPSSRNLQLAQGVRYPPPAPPQAHQTEVFADPGAETYSAHSLAYANSQLSQYLAQIGMQQQQQQQHQDSQAGTPGYLNPHALSTALSDYATMQVENDSMPSWSKATAASAPTSAGASPPDTPHPIARKRMTSNQYSGASTTGSATPLHPVHHPHTSRVAASPITGKRLNWGEMIVHTIADSEDGRLVVHDLFERMAERFPEICEWAHGDGWEGRVKNRIKSTLSIKSHLFVKVARDATTPRVGPGIDTSKSKGSWWTLSSEAQAAWKEGRVATAVKAKHHSGGSEGRVSRSGASSAATSRRNSPSRARSARGVASGHQKTSAQQSAHEAFERTAAAVEERRSSPHSTLLVQSGQYSMPHGQMLQGDQAGAQQHSPATMVQAAAQLPSSHSYLFAQGQSSAVINSAQEPSREQFLYATSSNHYGEGMSTSMTFPWQTDVTALGLRYVSSGANRSSPPAWTQQVADGLSGTRSSMSPDGSSASASGSASGSSGAPSHGRPLNNVSLTLPVGSPTTTGNGEAPAHLQNGIPGISEDSLSETSPSTASPQFASAADFAAQSQPRVFDSSEGEHNGMLGDLVNSGSSSKAAAQPQFAISSPQQGYDFSYEYAPLNGETDMSMLRMGGSGMGDLDLNSAVMSMPGLQALDLNDMSLDYSALSNQSNTLADFSLATDSESAAPQSPSSRPRWMPG